MFTWNLQFVSKKRLADTLRQMMVNSRKGDDILVRIHTAVHSAEEAVDLAAFVKAQMPGAQILGTSTSAIISNGRMIHDQCMIFITQMSQGSVRVVRMPLKGDEGPAGPAALCTRVRDALVSDNTRLLLAFFPEMYRDIDRLMDICNEQMPGLRMLGGVLDTNDLLGESGFVFDENGWSGTQAIFAALDGDQMECATDFAAGVQAVGDPHTITGAVENRILEVDGRPVMEFMHEGIGEETCRRTDIGYYFPLAYSMDGYDIPFAYGYKGAEGLSVNHHVTVGKRIRRAFIYDRKIVLENRSMFNRVESFEKGETLFAYACSERFRICPNAVRWELSAYQNSNMGGCLTRGEISSAGGKNIYINCAFALAVAGENPETQRFNPYVFAHTESLAEDSRKLIGYLTFAMRSSGQDADSAMNESLKSFVRSCQQMLLFHEKQNTANEAALNMDIRLSGYDRVCMIDVPDVTGMRAVFSGERIEKTHGHLVSECVAFASQKNYRVYMLREWRMAVAVPSYMVSLPEFTQDMKRLQRKLFEVTEEDIAIVPVFCVINECTTETLKMTYDAARMEMMQKNIQFYVCDGREQELDEESIRERYRMVNLINHALSHDGVVPYYQGIHDNRTNRIHHYEALMRLRDENGRVYTPGAFLDVARSYGLLYDALSMTMIRKVFETFEHREDLSVSINLGMRDIKNEEITGYIYSFLSTTRHPEHFIFEILENEDVDEYETLLRFVNSIHRLGGQIAIDDFGNGYSNLMHMISIPSDYLKIDGSIVRECCKNRDSENLVAMLSSWNRMNTHASRIVAEYVNSHEIQKKLVEFGIDFSQGYLFSKPSPDMEDS